MSRAARTGRQRRRDRRVGGGSPVLRLPAPETSARFGPSPGRRRGRSIRARRSRRSGGYAPGRSPMRRVSAAERAEGDRVGDHVESCLLEDAHRPGHMKRGGHQQPSLRRASDGPAHAVKRAFSSVLRDLSSSVTRAGSTPRSVRSLLRLARFGRVTVGEERAAAAGENHSRLRIEPRQDRGLDDALALRRRRSDRALR